MGVDGESRDFGRVATLLVKERPSSIWKGSDEALLNWAIPFYWRDDSRPCILDATYGGGRFWAGTEPRAVIDLVPQFGYVLRMSNEALAFRDSVFDVVVYDPPHLPERHIGKDYGGLMALYKSGLGRDNIEGLFPKFISEAYRVLRPGGIVLAKITDSVHRGRAHWPHVAFINLLRETGMVVCDLIIKTRQGPMIDPKWKNAYHARKRHCFWVVARKGSC